MMTSSAELLAVLRQYNPWWRGGPIADLPGWRRRAFHDVLAWMQSPPAPRALLLSGARQVGKTFSVNRLAAEFGDFIPLNLERPAERALFSGFNTGAELLERILLYKAKRLTFGNALLFIDEIQHCAEAVRALRYLYEDVKGLHVIAAGSLLEVFSQREGFSFPLGRVNNLFMYPVTFLEYLESRNPPLAETFLQADVLAPLPFHDLLLDAFNAYAFVGGMPEALAAHVETGSYGAVQEIHDALLRGYVEDVEKYSNLARAKYLSHVIDRAPLYAGQRVTYEKFGESAFRSREMREAFDVLERALIVYRARPSVSIRIPVVEKLRLAPKLFFLDVGLVNHRIGFREFFANRALDTVLQGRIAEQVAAQELVARTFQPPALHFWVREKGAAETDFLYPFKGHVIPVEIKSGGTGKLKSLHLFMQECPHPYAVRVYSGKTRLDRIPLPSGKTYDLYSIPYYLLSRLDDLLDRVVSS